MEHDIDVEHVFDTEVLRPVVTDVAQEVAVETLEYYSTKAFHMEQREVILHFQKYITLVLQRSCKFIFFPFVRLYNVLFFVFSTETRSNVLFMSENPTTLRNEVYHLESAYVDLKFSNI